MRTFGPLLFTILLTLLFVHWAGQIVLPTTLSDPLCAVKAFHQQDKNRFDVLVFGSSHAWKGVDTRVMNEMGISAYNVATDWQRINTVNLFVHDSLRTQHPKVILIETFYVNELTWHTDLVGEIYLSKQLPFSISKVKYLYNCFGRDPERYLSYAVPLVAFHSNWVDIKRRSFMPEHDTAYFSNSYGFYDNNEVAAESIPIIRAPQIPLDTHARQQLDEIISICKEKGVQPVFFTIPYNGLYDSFDAITAYTSENACPYLNLFEHLDELGLDPQTDFADTDHLNTNGAQKIAAFIGTWLQKEQLL